MASAASSASICTSAHTLLRRTGAAASPIAPTRSEYQESYNFGFVDPYWTADGVSLGYNPNYYCHMIFERAMERMEADPLLGNISGKMIERLSGDCFNNLDIRVSNQKSARRSGSDRRAAWRARG